MNNYEVEVDDFYYSSVEFAICRAYDMGLPNSSNFMELKPGSHSTITIDATKASGTFGVLAYTNKDGKNIISFSGTVKRKRR